MEEEPNQMEQDWSIENYFFKINDQPREGKTLNWGNCVKEEV